MSHDFDVDQAAQIIRSAFSPLTCHANSGDYGKSLSFTVTSGDDAVLTVDDLLADQFSTERRLRFIISESRAAVEDKGHALDAWSFPAAA